MIVRNDVRRDRMEMVIETEKMRLIKEILGSYGTNTYIVVCRRTGESAVIDAPARPSTVIKLLEGTVPKYILLTHNHEDHTGALTKLKSRLNVPLAAHELDAPELPVQPDIMLKDGDTVKFGELEMRGLHLPGHSPGSVGFLIGKYLISGDTLFPGGPGATWSPEGFRQLLATITGKLYILPDDTIVLPGHGDGTIIGRSKAEYGHFAVREHEPDLYGDVLWETS